jgi:hypothetical protein
MALHPFDSVKTQLCKSEPSLMRTHRSNCPYQTRRRLGGRHPLCGMGVVSLIDVTLMPA